MKNIRKPGPHHSSSSTPKLPFGTRIAAFLTGSSTEELVNVPDAEHRAIRLAGLSLSLVSLATMLGWGVALGIARGYTLANLPYVMLAGALIYVIDRAILRAMWFRAGIRAAKSRGFQHKEPKAWSSLLTSILLRIVVSLIIALTTASFIELEVFRQDIDAYLTRQAQDLNKPLHHSAEMRVDAEIQQKMNEIARYDEQIESITQDAQQAHATALATSTSRMKSLTSERENLKVRVTKLSKELDCQAQNSLAEEWGGVRCDGVRAEAGKKRRYEFASGLAEYARTERANTEARIAAIDTDLERLRASKASPEIRPATQDLIDQTTTLRNRTSKDLERLVQNRNQIIRDNVESDPSFVVMSDGLIDRGEALEALAKSSFWLAVRIMLVRLALIVLDLAAIFVISVLPAPRSLVLAEVLAAEVVMYNSMANAEQAICEAKHTILDAREMVSRTEDEVEQRVNSRRQAKRTRSVVMEQIDDDLETRFGRTG